MAVAVCALVAVRVAVKLHASRGCERLSLSTPGDAASGARTRQRLTAGLSAMRSAYAFAYGVESKSGNLPWIRRKIEEAVGDDDDDA